MVSVRVASMSKHNQFACNFVRSNAFRRQMPSHLDAPIAIQFGEAKLLIERRNPRWCRPQDPSDSPVVAHGRLWMQGSRPTPSADVSRRTNEPSKCSIRIPSAKGAQEASTWPPLNGHKRSAATGERSFRKSSALGTPAPQRWPHEQAAGPRPPTVVNATRKSPSGPLTAPRTARRASPQRRAQVSRSRSRGLEAPCS